MSFFHFRPLSFRHKIFLSKSPNVNDLYRTESIGVIPIQIKMKLNEAVRGILKGPSTGGGSDFTVKGDPDVVFSAPSGACVGDGLCQAGSVISGQGYPLGAYSAQDVVLEAVGSSSNKGGILDSYVGGDDCCSSMFMMKGHATGGVFVFDKKKNDYSDSDDASVATILLDCGMAGVDKVSKRVCGGGIEFINGARDGGSPCVLRLVRREGGGVDWCETAYDIDDDKEVGAGDGFYNCDRGDKGGRPELVLRCGLERGFVESWKDSYLIFGFSLNREDFLRTLVDFRYLKLLLLRGTVMVVLEGATDCNCRVGAANHYWLGAGKCGRCVGIESAGGGGGLVKCDSDFDYCMFGGWIGRRGHPQAVDDLSFYCDGLKRWLWFLMPASSRDIDLIVSHPIARVLSFVRAGMRDLVRDFDFTSYETMGRLTPLVVQALVLARQSYMSNQDMLLKGVASDGVVYSLQGLIPDFWYSGIDCEFPLVLGGPYDYQLVDGMISRKPSSNLCVSMLTKMGWYDTLVNYGMTYRPVEYGSPPFIYRGAYGKFSLPGEGRPYLSKGGAWGACDSLRKEEGPGMRYHIDFGVYWQERLKAEKEGRDLEEVRKEIIGGWRGGVHWGEGI